jgi:hypothetical protein
MLCKVVQSARFKPVVLATLVALSAPSARAFDGAIGSLTPSLSSTFQVGFDFPSPTFLDELTFSLDSAVTGSFTAKGQGFVIPGVLTLTPATGVSFAIYKGGSALTSFGTGFTGLSLAAGSDYAFMVKGGSGGYSVTWSLSPVPEPQSLALVLSGLAVLGSVARRRSSRG